MRDPFKDSGSADDWFNNLWTAEVDMSATMYGNTGTDIRKRKVKLYDMHGNLIIG